MFKYVLKKKCTAWQQEYGTVHCSVLCSDNTQFYGILSDFGVKIVGSESSKKGPNASDT